MESLLLINKQRNKLWSIANAATHSPAIQPVTTTEASQFSKTSSDMVKTVSGRLGAPSEIEQLWWCRYGTASRIGVRQRRPAMSIAAIAKMFKLTASQVSHRLSLYEGDFASYKDGAASRHPEKVSSGLSRVTERFFQDRKRFRADDMAGLYRKVLREKE